MIAKRSGRLMDGFYTRCRKGPRINCCNIPITLKTPVTGSMSEIDSMTKSAPRPE
jgi:hypothetical protein